MILGLSPQVLCRWQRLARPTGSLSVSPFSLQKHGIPVPVTPQTPWSMDENLMHIR